MRMYTVHAATYRVWHIKELLLLLSHWQESIWIMSRSTCQACLSWHMDRSPNTYIYLTGEREAQRRRAHSLHCRVPAFSFVTTYLGAWIDNWQRGACTSNTASITTFTRKNCRSEMRSITLPSAQVRNTPHMTRIRTHNTGYFLFGECFHSKALDVSFICRTFEWYICKVDDPSEC